MSIAIPIISEFVDKGIKQARQEFKQLETTGAKAQFALKKAAIPATAALAGLAAGLADATKGAIEDAAAQDKLANQIRRSTGETDDAIKATEDWISAQGNLRAYADSDLRPALSKLVTVTGDLKESQELATLAMDIAAATGKPLTSVTDTLAKAYGGNVKALAKLDPSLRGIIDESTTAKDMFKLLGDTFGGAAEEAAKTSEGGFKKMTIALDETKESIGAALLPAVEKVLPYLIDMADWAQKNPGAFQVIAGAIAAVAGSIMLVNIAMSLNPIALIAAGIAILIVGLVAAYKKFEGFRQVVDAVFGAMKWWISNVTIPAFKTLWDIAKTIFNGIAKAWNNTIGKLSLTIPSWVPGIGGKKFEVPDIPLIGGSDSDGNRSAIPMMANGGIVTGPTIAMIGEAGPEAVIPLNRLGSMGGGVTINVNGGDPQAVVDALVRWSRQNGSLPSQVRVAS